MRQRSKSILNVVVDDESFRRIENGQQTVVFEDFDRMADIEKWYGKASRLDNLLVIKVWCNAIKKAIKISLSYVIASGIHRTGVGSDGYQMKGIMKSLMNLPMITLCFT